MIKSSRGNARRTGEINVRLLIILVAVLGLLVVGAFVARNVRRQAMIRQALADGRAAYDAGNWKDARINLRRWLLANPSDAEILRMYAQTQLRPDPLPRAAYTEAIRTYRQLLRIDPLDEESFDTIVRLLEATQNGAEMAQVAANRLDAAPNDPRALLARAKALLISREIEDANAALTDLVERFSGDEKQRDTLVQAYILLSEAALMNATPAAFGAALGYLDQAVACSADSSMALIARAVCKRARAEAAARLGDRAAAAEYRENARADLEALSALKIVDPRVILSMCEEWIAHRDYDRAEQMLTRAETEVDDDTRRRYIVDPADWIASKFLRRAKLLLARGDRSAGAAIALSAIENLEGRTQRVEMLLMAVRLLAGAGDVEAARQYLDEFKSAAKLLPQSIERDQQVAYLDALIAQADGKPYQAIDILEPWAERSDAEPVVRALLADAYRATGQTRRMLHVLDHPSVENVVRADTTLDLARTYIATGDFSSAIAHLERDGGDADPIERQLLLATASAGLAARLPEAERAAEWARLTQELQNLREQAPDSASVRVLLATVLDQAGHAEQAEATLRAAIDECTQHLPAQLALAAHYGVDRADEAEAILSQACAEHGHETQPWIVLSDLQRRLNQPDKAQATLHRGIETVTNAKAKLALRTQAALLEVLHGDRAAGVESLWTIARDYPDDVNVRTILLTLPDLAAEQSAPLIGELRKLEGERGLQWRYQAARRALRAPNWHEQREDIEQYARYCLAADPAWPGPALVLGELYERAGDAQAAEATFRAGFRASGAGELGVRLLMLLQQRGDPAARDVLVELGQRLDERTVAGLRTQMALEGGDLDEAIRNLELTVTGGSADPRDHILLAELAFARETDVDAAQAHLDRAAELGADAIAVTRSRVQILEASGRRDDALRALDGLVETDRTAATLTLRAQFLEQWGDAGEAERDYRAQAEMAADATGAARLGDFLARAGRLDEAIETWRAGLADFADDPAATELRRGLCKVLLMRDGPGDRQAATELLDTLQDELPSDTDLIWVRVVTLLDKGPGSEAQIRKLLQQAAQTPRAPAPTYIGLIGAAMRIGAVDSGRALVGRAMRQYPMNVDLLRLAARLEASAGNTDAARSYADRVLARSPAEPGALDVLLTLAIRRSDQAAIRALARDLEQFATADAESEDLQVLLARARLATGERDKATAALEAYSTTEAGSQSLATRLALADAYHAAGDLDKAWENLNAAEALDPRSPRVQRSQMLLLVAQRRFDEIVALAEAYPDTQPGLDALLLLAAEQLSANAERLDAAEALCRRALAQAPENTDVQARLALILYQRGDLASAVQAYRAVCAADDENHEAFNNLAWLLASGDAPTEETLEEALTCAKRAVAVARGDANYRETLGMVLVARGELSDARDELQRGLGLAPPNSTVRAKLLRRLALARDALGDRDGIAGQAREALNIDANVHVFSPEQRTELEELLLKTNGRPQ